MESETMLKGEAVDTNVRKKLNALSSQEHTLLRESPTAGVMQCNHSRA